MTRFHELRQHFGFFLILCMISLCVGLLVNQFNDKPLRLVYETKEERLQKSVEKLVEQGQGAKPVATILLPEVLSLEEFKSYVEDKQGLVLDARPEIFHRLGHVPGALSLPRDDFENVYPTLKDKLEADHAQPLVIYCASLSCEDAGLVKRSLAALGFTQLKVFEGGWAEWTDAGKPRETN